VGGALTGLAAVVPGGAELLDDVGGRQAELSLRRRSTKRPGKHQSGDNRTHQTSLDLWLQAEAVSRPMLFKPYFVRDYRRMVRTLIERHGYADAMSRSVGGDYEGMGRAQSQVLCDEGLRDTDMIIDVGCGSGRTAFALSRIPSLRYFGIDVVPELIEHAKAKAARPDWRFEVVEGLAIPAPDHSADMVVFFSVVTHLTWNESQRYLDDALRVLKPNGKLLFSYLEKSNPRHMKAVGSLFERTYHLFRGHGVKNVTLSEDQIRRWADQRQIEFTLRGPEALGQTYCVVKR